eukprot:14252098-Ditylum_brightwellii.AAC.1
MTAESLQKRMTHCLKGGTIGYKADVFNIEQDIVGYKDFRIQCQVIQKLLTFLHASNPLCADINIDFNPLFQLPEDGSIKGEVNVVEEEELRQDAQNISVAAIETNVSPIQATLGSEQGGASG